MKGTIYLIHFDSPFKHAKHYLGWAKDLDARLEHHRNGTGANLMRVLKEHGIGWVVARLWHDADRNYERSLKNRGGASRLCPICKGDTNGNS